MKNQRVLYTLLFCMVLGVTWLCVWQPHSRAEEAAQYVGPEQCNQCHADVAKTWALTHHRATLFNTDPSRKGCEACHGPGSAHIESGGDPELIIRPEKLKPEKAAAICMKCHDQADVTLWRTSLHARSKLGCTNCHNSHSPSSSTFLKNIENGKLSLEGLTRMIEQLEVEANAAPEKAKARAEANDKLQQLKRQRDTLRQEIKGQETAYQRSAEPYLCYNCHKQQQVQGRMVSRHPIQEGKIKCSDCHNPHGGPHGMLREESVNETCFRCHAEKEGPFTFEHPPVSEDCTICHNPHGSVQNNLLLQGEPFLCLKCHAGPHSRSAALGSARSLATYYTECTDCHVTVHGSDEHAPLHY